tara:strand:- start:296 stop:511 length:216 start_codon:yes stop_codon:yes gene_type:complete
VLGCAAAEKEIRKRRATKVLKVWVSFLRRLEIKEINGMNKQCFLEFYGEMVFDLNSTFFKCDFYPFEFSTG